MQHSSVVVKCSPNSLPNTLPYVIQFASTKNISVSFSTHIHSDLKILNPDEHQNLLNFIPKNLASEQSSAVLHIVIIFSNLPSHKSLIFNAGTKEFESENNLFKYLVKKLSLFEDICPVDEAKIDDFHKLCAIDNDRVGSTKLLKEYLQSKTEFLSSKNTFGPLDLFCFSNLSKKDLPSELSQWHKRCSDLMCKETVPNNDSNEISNNSPKEKVFEFFKKHDINYDTFDHPEVFTVETMLPYLKDIPASGAISKNLFLKDKKNNLYLLSALHDKNVNLSAIAKSIKAPGGGLRLASEDILFQTLGVKQGCVTAYALINDMDEKKVKFLADEDLVNGKYDKVYFHPLDNSSTTGIMIEDFKKFVDLTGHNLTTISL